MEIFGWAALFGLVLGFLFGVGCAAAVMYTIYNGGYRRAVEDSLNESHCARYDDFLEAAVHKRAKGSHPTSVP